MLSKRSALVIPVVILALCSLFLTGCGSDKPSFTSEYQAVFLANGQVFFGKMESTGSQYPMLREVYYIGQQTSPDGKETKNILIKRGNEWHGPDYMYINRQHIVVVEPISANSRVAQLIKDAKSQTQPQGGTK